MLKKLIMGIHLKRLSKNVNVLLAKVNKLPTPEALKFYSITCDNLSKTLIGMSGKIFTPANCEAITKAIIAYHANGDKGAGVAFKKKF